MEYTAKWWCAVVMDPKSPTAHHRISMGHLMLVRIKNANESSGFRSNCGWRWPGLWRRRRNRYCSGAPCFSGGATSLHRQQIQDNQCRIMRWRYLLTVIKNRISAKTRIPFSSAGRNLWSTAPQSPKSSQQSGVCGVWTALWEERKQPAPWPAHQPAWCVWPLLRHSWTQRRRQRRWQGRARQWWCRKWHQRPRARFLRCCWPQRDHAVRHPLVQLPSAQWPNTNKIKRHVRKWGSSLLLAAVLRAIAHVVAHLVESLTWLFMHSPRF